jgi:hypothetical protein
MAGASNNPGSFCGLVATLPFVLLALIHQSTWKAFSKVRNHLATLEQQQESLYSRKIGDSTYAFRPSS